MAGSFKIKLIEGRIIGIGFNPDYSSRTDIVLEYNIDEEDWVRLNKTTEEHLHSGGHASVPAALFGCS